MTHLEREELAPLYPLGLLSEREARLVEAEAGADQAFAAELDGFREVAGLLALAAPAAAPRPMLRDQLASAPPARVITEVEPGIFVHRATDGNWMPTPFPGVFVKQVAFDAERSVATNLIRMEPGAEFPNHTHRHEEQCYVISGDVVLGNVELRTGDFSRAAAGSRHGKVFTRLGCTLLLSACTHDEFA